MKKPRNFPVLLNTALIFLAFVLGVFMGRNYFSEPITVSVPKEMLMPPPMIQPSDIGTGFSSPININTASVAELSELPGIGDGLAGRIVDYREKYGNFTHVEQLIQVPGIGETTLEALLSYITIGGTQ